VNTPEGPREQGTIFVSLDKGEEEEGGGNKAPADKVLKPSLRQSLHTSFDLLGLLAAQHQEIPELLHTGMQPCLQRDKVANH